MLFTNLCISPRIDFEPFLFYTIATGVVYPTVAIKQGTKLEIGKHIPLNGMFELYELQHKGVRVGYLFKSTFTMEIKGGYLVAFMKGKGIAETHEVLLKLDHLVIYNFPNRGTLAASPTLAANIQNILESQ